MKQLNLIIILFVSSCSIHKSKSLQNESINSNPSFKDSTIVFYRSCNGCNTPPVNKKVVFVKNNNKISTFLFVDNKVILTGTSTNVFSYFNENKDSIQYQKLVKTKDFSHYFESNIDFYYNDTLCLSYSIPDYIRHNNLNKEKIKWLMILEQNVIKLNTE